MLPASNPIREEFARRLKVLRISRGFKTARSLARALGIDENRYTRYERAEVEPDLELIRHICETLHVTPNELLSGAAAGSSSTASPGFAEIPPPPSDAEVKTIRRRALAWQLAHQLTTVAMQAETDKAAAGEDASRALLLTSKVYNEIEANPFAFFTRLSGDPALTEMDRQQEGRITALINDLIAAVTASVLG